MIQTEIISQEVSALEKRTRRLIKSGVSILITGLVILILSCTGYIVSRSLGPNIHDFIIDVPALLIPSSPGAFSDLTFSGGSLIFSSTFLIIPIVFSVLFLALKVMKGEAIIPSAIILVLVVTGTIIAKLFMGVFLDVQPADSLSPGDVVKQFVNDDKPADLIDYLEKNSSQLSKNPVLLEYVKSQASIKENKPDIALIKNVIADYKSNPTLKNAPASVMYALEMTAFKETNTPSATIYEQEKIKKSRLLKAVSIGGFSIALILVFIGGVASLWGGKMKKRVKFINML